MERTTLQPASTAASARAGWAPSIPAGLGAAPGYVYGGFWFRVVAYWLDVIGLTLISLGLWLSTGLTVVDVGTSQSVAPNGTVMYGGFVMFNGLALLLHAVYHAVFWAVLGATPGMLACGLRVVRAADGRRLGPGRALVRSLALLPSIIMLLIGVIWIAADPRKQGWHDKLARTFVVRPTS